MTTPTIRLLSAADADAFQRVRLSALEENPEAFLSVLADEQQKATNRFAQELTYSSLIAPFGYYGCFIDTQLVGYVLISSTFLGKQRHAAFLYNLYFDPAYRHQGLASQLLQFTLKLLREEQIEWLYASCISVNQAAQAFYQRMGFVEYGRRPSSVKDNGAYADEVELALKITS